MKSPEVTKSPKLTGPAPRPALHNTLLKSEQPEPEPTRPVQESEQSPELQPYESDADMPDWLIRAYATRCAIPERPEMPADYEAKVTAYKSKLMQMGNQYSTLLDWYNDALSARLFANWHKGIFDEVTLWQTSEREAAQQIEQLTARK